MSRAKTQTKRDTDAKMLNKAKNIMIATRATKAFVAGFEPVAP